jgi:hypothetical protein
MAQALYCWRCDMVLPMLDEEEWARMVPLLNSAMSDVQRYRETHGVGLAEARDVAFGQRALNLYRDLTGFDETAVGALWHHRLSLYGPPCCHCGKPLRTPQAKLCAACGRDRAPAPSI